MEELEQKIEDLEKQVQSLEELVDDLSSVSAEHFYNTIQMLSDLTATQERYYEGSHSRFVAQKSTEIATELDLSQEAIFEIQTAALLHDIGKIGFKEALLAKYQNEMKDNELAQYYLHPSVGQKLLSRIPMFDKIGRIILQHHERLDGSGFPNHLQGKEILPGAAIIGVVDTFHNMFYKRTKDKTLGGNNAIQNSNNSAYIESTKGKFGNAMNFLHIKSGQLFDSKVVEIFTLLMEDERKAIGEAMVMRLPINKIEPGWLIAEDYYTSYGFLIAARGEKMTPDIQRALIRLAESGEVPLKILVMKP